MAVEVGRCLLRQLLAERDMTQTELARLTGKSKSKISDYVNDRKKMSYDAAVAIAFVLECYAEDLYELVVVGDRQKK